MLLDSNIIIYSAMPNYPGVQEFLEDNDFCVSAVSQVEVLGFHRLTEPDRLAFELFFQAIDVLPIDALVLEKAIALRQQRKLSLGDALVAGTAIAYDRALVTHNMADFDWIEGLEQVDPID